MRAYRLWLGGHTVSTSRAQNQAQAQALGNRNERAPPRIIALFLHITPGLEGQLPRLTEPVFHHGYRRAYIHDARRGYRLFLNFPPLREQEAEKGDRGRDDSGVDFDLAPEEEIVAVAGAVVG